LVCLMLMEWFWQNLRDSCTLTDQSLTLSKIAEMKPILCRCRWSNCEVDLSIW
jgi:hypothetical protein